MTSRRKDPTSNLSGDSNLLNLLSEALRRVDPIPQSALEQAYAAHLMGDIDAELAQLVFDSSTTKQPSLRRGDETESRFLSFTNDHLTLDLSLLADGKTIIGEIDPATSSEIVIERRNGDSSTVPVDQFGRFKAATESPSFRIRVVGHLVTQWITR